MQELVKDVSKLLRQKGLMLVTAESCTGGLISSVITEQAGSSSIFDRSFVTYSNEAKHDMLGVLNDTLMQFGAVSEETAREMVEGALKNSLGDIAIAVTGIAGPTGDTPEKPIGLVYIGVGVKNHNKKKQAKVIKCNFDGNRSNIRNLTVIKALEEVKNILERDIMQ